MEPTIKDRIEERLTIMQHLKELWKQYQKTDSIQAKIRIAEHITTLLEDSEKVLEEWFYEED